MSDKSKRLAGASITKFEGTVSIQIDFLSGRHHAVRLEEGASREVVAERLHCLADGIRHDVELSDFGMAGCIGFYPKDDVPNATVCDHLSDRYCRYFRQECNHVPEEVNDGTS